MIAAAGTLVAGTIAERSARPVGAVNPPVLLGQDNVPATNLATSITAPSGFGEGSTSLFFASAFSANAADKVDGIGASGGLGGAGCGRSGGLMGGGGDGDGGAGG